MGVIISATTKFKKSKIDEAKEAVREQNLKKLVTWLKNHKDKEWKILRLS